MKKKKFFIGFSCLFLFSLCDISSQNKIYLALDDHTDYYWRATGPTYDSAFVEMIDYYLDLADSTINHAPNFQSRFNCDGSYWMYVYEKRKPEKDFKRLINRIKSGHLTVPLNPMICVTGGVPAEAILRGLYYTGRIERKHDIRFNIAYAIEDQTSPFGLSSLFSGSGAKYTWHGICACHTNIADIKTRRKHEIYWRKGRDDSKMLMKWYSIGKNNRTLGGYAEARHPDKVVTKLYNKLNTPHYPYSIGGAFGKGWDDLKTKTTEFIDVAKNRTNDSMEVIVSSEHDFFVDFDSTYGGQLPEYNVSYGNDWDMHMASAQELISRTKRSVEKLRNAEALATMVSLNNPDFMESRKIDRDSCFMNMGIFYEHNWNTASRWVTDEQRIAWSKRLASNIENYVNDLYNDAAKELAAQINKTGEDQYYVFNALSWKRTDFADLKYEGPFPVYVMDLETEEIVPSEKIIKSGKHYVRIMAPDIPSVGYKVFQIKRGKTDNFHAPFKFDTATGMIENGKIKIKVQPNGAIKSLTDKTRDEEFVKPVNGKSANFLIEHPLEWKRDSTFNEKTERIVLPEHCGEVQLEHIGQVSATLKITSFYPVKHTTRITLFRGSDRVCIRNEITENFGNELKWQFSFNIDNPEIWHEEVGAVINAKIRSNGGHYANSHARYEWLTANHFIDMSNSHKGITISNADLSFFQSGYSTISFLDEKTPIIKMLAGGQFYNERFGFIDQDGNDYFLQRLALQMHDAYDQTRAMKFSLEHQNPLVSKKITGGKGYESNVFSLIRISHPEVLLWALKPAEEGIQRGITARVWNMADKPVNLTFGKEPKKINELTHIETVIGEPDNPVNHQQMKTYLLIDK